MMSAPSTQNGRPDAAAVRAQVARMTASDVFANSPQLAAFLLFVVEAVLRGKGDRLKGYTIGVEVLRRDVSFDPQVDPIVRVEATRLRPASERYYAGPGADDPILIELPRGGYVPRISRRAERVSAAPSVSAPPQPAEPVALSPGNGMPTLRVAPFVVVGTPDTRAIAADTLGGKLAEAFARFDMINVVAAASPAPGNRSDYRLDGTVEYRGKQVVDLRFKLVDESDSTVIWSRSFDRLSGAEGGDIERKLILELASVIIEPYGVISAHDQARRSDHLDPRYRIMLEAGEAFRSVDPAAHVRVRDGLEQLTVIDPNFAVGFSYLAGIYAREYLFGFGARPGDTSPLDRALKAARRGIELKPQSARAYHILFIVLFFRAENDAAVAAAEKAIALNPYDMLIMSDYGGRLILAGEVDGGMDILRDAVGYAAILPSWNHFYLFLGHYLRGDLSEARFHAGQLTSETYVFGQLARALMANSDGQAEEVRRCIQVILSIAPDWSTDARREIGKLVTGPAVADRLAGDLGAAGLSNGQKD